MTSTCNYRM